MDEQLKFLEQNKKRQRDEAMHLTNTRKAIDCWRLARSMGKDPQFNNELFQLIRQMAIFEWGPGTEVDDYNLPGKCIIKNGKREEII